MAICGLFLLLLSISSMADSQGDRVAGAAFKFTIPSRPVGTEYAHELSYKFAQSNQSFYIDPNYRNCPITSKFLHEIYDQIITANDLTSFKAVGLLVGCLDVFPESGGATIKMDGGISAPVSLAQFSQSDDELAFVLAHEIAHIILGHNELLIDSLSGFKNETLEVAFQRREHSADELGAVLMANTQFDPHAAADLLWHSAQYQNLALKKRKTVDLNYGAGTAHGSLQERIDRIESKLASIGFTEKRARSTSPMLAQAKIENRKIIKNYKKLTE
jgi:hypothetical protein